MSENRYKLELNSNKSIKSQKDIRNIEDNNNDIGNSNISKQESDIAKAKIQLEEIKSIIKYAEQ